MPRVNVYQLVQLQQCRELLKEARQHLHHTCCLTEDATLCPGCSIGARIEELLKAGA